MEVKGGRLGSLEVKGGCLGSLEDRGASLEAPWRMSLSSSALMSQVKPWSRCQARMADVTCSVEQASTHSE